MVNVVTKTDDCKFSETCSFYGAQKCNDKRWKKTSDCIIYKLIEDVQELKNKLI